MKSSLVLILFVTIVLGGCTVYSEFYLRNTTEEPKQITLIAYKDINKRRFEFLYADSLIKDIKYGTYNYLDKKEGANAQGRTVSISIPPKSTLHLGAGRVFSQTFEKVVIDKDTFDLNSTGRFQTSYEKLDKYAVWLDIK
jgi:hypothetical protein